jgi:predicted alpha/beta hydrolase family esterase
MLQAVKNYGHYDGLDIWTEKCRPHFHGADYFVAHSLGWIYVLRNFSNPRSKYILVNPPLKTRNILSQFWKCIKFLIFEGIKMEKLVPFKFWLYALKKARHLLSCNGLAFIKNVPAKNIIIIRGKKDNFFCDDEAVTLIKEMGIRLIEVGDAGHDWNENISKMVQSLLCEN